MSVVKKPFGKLPDGRDASLYTIENASGASVSITDFGGTLVSVVVPDRSGKLGDVLLGYSSVEGYFPNCGYLGALIGRVGNRIGRGACTLNGSALHLAQNAGGHHLHGGDEGFDRKLWAAEPDGAHDRLILTYVSPDGEEHYPGTLAVRVTYAFSPDNALTIHYEAVSDKDTLCNLTNHAYFNLAGEGSGDVLNHTMCIHADAFTVGDCDLIPTGEQRPVAGTLFDLRTPVRIGDGLEKGLGTDEQMKSGQGYDHNFMINGTGMREAAVVTCPATGRVMRVVTDQPGVQFYGGNCLAGVNNAKCGRPYGRFEGLCLETQCPPDAINHPEFPSIILRAGKRYDTQTTYVFSVE